MVLFYKPKLDKRLVFVKMNFDLLLYFPRTARSVTLNITNDGCFSFFFLFDVCKMSGTDHAKDIHTTLEKGFA